MSTAADTHALFMQASASYRLQHLGVRIDGGNPLDFARYPYIPEIIDNHCRRTTIIKGAQLGLSIACIIQALEGARTGKLRGILYGFPSEKEVQDFSKARFGPLMAANPGVWTTTVSDVDAAGLKQIGSTFIFFRGIGQRGGAVGKSLSNVKSFPADWMYLDEFDEMDQSRVSEVMHRLDAQKNPEFTSLSTPTLPAYGVDLDYQSSDQRSWQWKCGSCGGWTCLEDGYPECISEPVNGDPFYLCSRCRGPLDRKRGQWVARKTDVHDHRGYWISQLCSPTKEAKDIVVDANHAMERGRMRAFYNQTLARPYAEVEDQITREQLEALLTDDPRPLRHEGPSAMGVDPGKPHWYEVRVRISDKDTVQIARGRADTYEELSQIAKRYNVEAGVMDQGADATAVSKFVEAHPGWYGCLYVNAKKTDPDWNHADRIVKTGRTWLLDDAQLAIVNKRVKFHARDEFWEREFVPQMTNLKRIVLEDDETGARDHKWVVTGGRKNDHLRHANAYAHLACERVGLVKSIERMESRARRESSSRRAKPRSFAGL